LLPDTPENRRYAGKYLEVYQFPEGRIQIREAGVSLPYSTYDKLGAIDQGAIVENKRLGHESEIQARYLVPNWTNLSIAWLLSFDGLR
jgi:hypothetical protein